MSIHPAVAKKELAPSPEPLPAPVIDAHTHLDACGIESAVDVDAAMARAAAVGVVAAITVGGDMVSNRWSVRAAAERRHSGADLAADQAQVRPTDLFAAVAVHPTEAQTLTDEARSELEKLAAAPEVVAIGETGLDFYWDSAPHEMQAEAFAWHIDLAKRLGKPLMIHDRLAHDRIFDILGAEGAPDSVIFHCFSGDEGMARRCADHGWVMSFAGPVSFTNAPDLHRAAAAAPLDLIMVETDAPFLTPHPHRGRRNEPFALPYTVRAIAQIRQISVIELCEAVSINTERTYGISVINR